MLLLLTSANDVFCAGKSNTILFTLKQARANDVSVMQGKIISVFFTIGIKRVCVYAQH